MALTVKTLLYGGINFQLKEEKKYKRLVKDRSALLHWNLELCFTSFANSSHKSRRNTFLRRKNILLKSQKWESPSIKRFIADERLGRIIVLVESFVSDTKAWFIMA